MRAWQPLFLSFFFVWTGPLPAARAQERPLPSSRVYPNPATTTAYLDYELPKAGPVLLELLDGRGKALRTVTRHDKQPKGPHTFPVEVGDLPAGTYFLQLHTRAGAETRRFVKQ